MCIRDRGYVYVEVEVGISDESYTQILSGLQEGCLLYTSELVRR